MPKRNHIVLTLKGFSAESVTAQDWHPIKDLNSVISIWYMRLGCISDVPV